MYGKGEFINVEQSFFGESTKRTAINPALRNNEKIQTFLGGEYRDAFKIIPELEDGTKIRASYAFGIGTTTYTISSKKGKKMIQADGSRYRAVQVGTPSNLAKILGRPSKVEIIKGRV